MEEGKDRVGYGRYCQLSISIKMLLRIELVERIIRETGFEDNQKMASNKYMCDTI